jgi:hypothetical protein
MTSTDEYFFLKLQIETEDSKIEIKKSHKDLKEILEQQNCKTNSISKKPLNEQKSTSRRNPASKFLYATSKRK